GGVPRRAGRGRGGLGGAERRRRGAVHALDVAVAGPLSPVPRPRGRGPPRARGRARGRALRRGGGHRPPDRGPVRDRRARRRLHPPPREAVPAERRWALMVPAPPAPSPRPRTRRPSPPP